MCSPILNQQNCIMWPCQVCSFLAGGGTKNQKHMRGIFDGGVETHIVGDVMIYEAVRDYIKATAPLDRVIDGRLVVTATTPSGGVTQKLGLLVTVVTLLC